MEEELERGGMGSDGIFEFMEEHHKRFFLLYLIAFSN